jgi:omega-hydroxy-beta-dihydromenaquinone-9 sulfotransferase
MSFNFKLFFRIAYHSLFKTRNTHYRLTPKRILLMTIFFTLYPLVELFNFFCFWLDDIFFPGYHQQEIRKPIFIVGNARSGTTLLHRMMAHDEESFTSLATWEILLAPAIIQRKFIWALTAIDRRIGKPMHFLVDRLERAIPGPNAHKMGLNEPEEDEYLLAHNFSTMILWTIFPVRDELIDLFYFDEQVSPEAQKKSMDFYYACIQRHLYAHGGDKTLLSKNPSFTARIQALRTWFPDARIISTNRNPLEMVPSLMSWMSAGWHTFCNPLEKYLFREEVLRLTHYYYWYPLELLHDAPVDRYAIVRYDDLTADPEAVITGIYQQLEIDMSPIYARKLKASSEKARAFQSRHNYSLNEIGISRDEILSHYEDIFEFFDFDEEAVGEQIVTAETRKERRLRRKALRQARRSRRVTYRLKWLRLSSIEKI